MIKQFIYDAAIIGCILISSGFSLALFAGAIEAICHKDKKTDQ